MDTTLIFGGSGGIGSAIARRLAARGDPVHLVGRDSAKLDALAREIGADFSVIDVTDLAGLAEGVGEIAANTPLKGLVYAVGTITVKPFSSVMPEDIARDFAINAAGAALALQAAAPGLKAASGDCSVVLFSSVAVAQGFTGHVSISMAKAAVEGLTRALAAELAPKIRVNCIAPSLTRTPLAAALTGNEALAKAVADLHALRRLGEAEDVAALAAFLLSAEASWMTGQIIGVDGGRSALRTRG